MIALLDNGQDLAECEREIGVPVGQLLTPLTRYQLRDPLLPWGIDNGFFSKVDVRDLFSLMKREEHHRENCLFVTVPDIVCNAQRTRELFDHFAPQMVGWKLAFACQDGQENLPIPWDKIDAVFIGGSDSWKCSKYVAQIIKVAKLLGKHVHIGRVNTPDRYVWFEEQGADTADGTGMARYTHMRVAIANRRQMPGLFEQGEAA